MKLPVLFVHILFLVLITLPGCCRYIEWGKRTFYQGKNLPSNTALVRRYIRSVNVYTQFATSAIFDALWLSDQVRTAYTHVHSVRLAKDSEHERTFLWRQLEENNHFISFYVLSLYDVPLGGSQDDWSVSLIIKDQFYAPLEITVVDLPPEYRVFMSREVSRFKTAYYITFNAENLEGNPLIDETVCELCLQFRSTQKSVTLSWKIDQRGELQKPYCISRDEPYTMKDGPCP